MKSEGKKISADTVRELMRDMGFTSIRQDSKEKIKRAPSMTNFKEFGFDGVLQMAETAGFEPAGDCSLTDFESFILWTLADFCRYFQAV